MREIGGYFELERFSGREYHEGALALNCGRACLEFLIKLRGISAIWLPDWLCDSVAGVCRKCGVQVRTYAVGADFRPMYDFELGASDYLFVVDYYGQLDV